MDILEKTFHCKKDHNYGNFRGNTQYSTIKTMSLKPLASLSNNSLRWVTVKKSETRPIQCYSTLSRMFWNMFILHRHSTQEPTPMCWQAGWPILFLQSTLHRNLHQSNVMISRMAYFILWANIKSCAAQISVKKQGRYQSGQGLRKKLLAVGEVCMAVLLPTEGFI